MTKKDYIKFARMMADLRRNKSRYDAESNAVVRCNEVEDELVRIFKMDNSAFDADRFLKDCNGD